MTLQHKKFQQGRPESYQAVSPLPKDFYQLPTVQVAQNLIGKVLVVVRDSRSAAVVLTECEAYLSDDAASHSYRGKTHRNASMFSEAGSSYVYLSYGLHQCLNVVTAESGVGEAVLLRAGIPLWGQDLMMSRRGKKATQHLANGPGKLCQALDVSLSDNARNFNSPDLFISDLGFHISKKNIHRTTRIGISKARELPLRFVLSLEGEKALRDQMAASSRPLCSLP